MAHHTMLTNDHTDSNKAYVHTNSTDPHPQSSPNPIFHDFLGMKNPSDSPLGFSPRTAADLRPSDPSPAASASRGPSSSGGRGPISTTSDLASDRQVGSHLEGVPFYGSRGDMSTTEIHNRIIGNKRSMSDSVFIGSYRDGVPHMASESHLMKTLRNGAGRELNRRANDDEVTLGMQQPMRPSAASVIFQPHIGSGSRLDADVTKWERSTLMNIGPAPAVQYSPRGTSMPFSPQLHTNRFRDANAIPPNISQSAADEGSRTGIKGPGILSSSYPGGGTSERNSSILLPSCSLQKPGTNIAEHESSMPSSRRGLVSADRQMTIFYGGQAHVFDDVHPNKADVIMALAGSSGDRGQLTMQQNQLLGQLTKAKLQTENSTSVWQVTPPRHLPKKLVESCVAGSSAPIASSVERVTASAGAGKDVRNQVQAAADSSAEKKREL
ncbi:protein TIFY 8-like isoform X1 [Cucurbita pepo subsp. pepo]|uniref:protein TIFY 8-like isoform X1 n=1 Tax=Cucurbita pepo subsp. pepo TaxID=3664 RepID=UPI000C9D9A8A|nr:protein TIFY 8-like isoform X1 [Cucurbita pepo subsp. pepo]